MDFATTFEEQLKKLQVDFPQQNYNDTMLPEVIARAYREEIMKPALLSLIDRTVCKPGRTDAEKFEAACLEILQWTIGIEFGLPVVPHTRTLTIAGQSVKVRDLTLTFPQHDGLERIWQSLKNEHKLKSIVFECKNYVMTNPVSKKEIFQLFEYLVPKTYGKLGVLISRFGKANLHANAKSAIFRLAQDDYQFIVLGDDEMVELITEFAKTGSCATFFAVQNEKARPHAG